MSRKRTTYSTEFKTKIVLEVLKGDKTIKRKASANFCHPKEYSKQAKRSPKVMFP